MNNLNATPEEVLWSVRAINRVGGGRGDNGLPYLLPGINVLVGLEGERKESLDINYRFLNWWGWRVNGKNRWISTTAS